MRGAWAAALLLGAGLLAGRAAPEFLPEARELEDMALAETLGVDRTGERLEVTAAVGADRLTPEETPPVLSACGESITGACLAMQGEGTAHVFYSHVGSLLLGTEDGGPPLRETLDFVLRDIEMRLETEIYLIKEGRASAVLRDAAREGAAARRLDALSEGGGTSPRTVLEVLSQLERDGCTYLPALKPDGAGRLVPAGCGLIREGAEPVWAEGAAADGVELLTGGGTAKVVEVRLSDGRRAALRLVETRTRADPVFRGERLEAVRVSCRLEANLAEGDCGLGEPGVRAQLEEALERWGREGLTAALGLARELGGDCFGLRRASGLRAPLRWPALLEQWTPETPVEVCMEGRVVRSYDARR